MADNLAILRLSEGYLPSRNRAEKGQISSKTPHSSHIIVFLPLKQADYGLKQAISALFWPCPSPSEALESLDFKCIYRIIFVGILFSSGFITFDLCVSPCIYSASPCI